MPAAPLLAAFEHQIAWCQRPAPFTARVLERSRRWLEDDAAAHAAFAAIAPDPLAAAVPLRWAAALHHLALRGLAPWAGLWPPAGGGLVERAEEGGALDTALDTALDAAITSAWHTQRRSVLAALASPPQTNEVQRSAALLPGLLHVAARTGLPLVLLEIGASAGLNLWCDRYRYEHGVWQWGDARSAVTMRSAWRGPPPAAAHAALRIARRAGCDARPIHLAQADESLRLASFIWPEQAERLARLHSAHHAAARWLAEEAVAVESLSAARFVARELRAPAAGHATVLMHSVVWQYIGAAEQAEITAAVEAAGRCATPGAPLAWLRFEPATPAGDVELRCRLWCGAKPGQPDGADTLLARAHPHGAHIEWLIDEAAP